MASKKQPALTPDQNQTLFNSLSTKLQASPTAYTPSAKPSNSDLRLQLQLMGLSSKMARDNAAAKSASVYGTPEPVDINNPLPPKEGPIVRGLHALSDPLYGIVGGAEALLGKGSKPGLANITANMNEQEGFGSLLQKEGVNKWISMPLGFALDVALDPVNWATAGTEAAVPKLFTGLTKGGVEGLTEAARSTVLSKAQKLARWTPFIDRAGVAARLGEKAGVAESAFREASGLPSVIKQAVDKGGITKYGSKAVNTLEKLPGSKTFMDKYVYSPGKRWADILKQIGQTEMETKAGISTSLDEVIQQMSNAAVHHPEDISGTLERSMRQKILDNTLNAGSTAALTPPSRDLLGKSGSLGIQNDFANVTEDLQRANEAVSEQLKKNVDSTGIKWFDDLRTKVNSGPRAKQIADTYAIMMGLFKVAKVGLNPVSYANAILGNATFAGMVGINITDARYLDTLKQTLKMVRGGTISPELAAAIKASPQLEELVTKYRSLANEINLDDAILKGAVSKSLKEELANLAHAGRTGDAAAMAKFTDLAQFPSHITAESPSFFSNDVLYGAFGAKVKEWGSQEPGIRKSIANLINKAGTAYGSVDQTYKIATVLHLHLNGITAEELQKLSRVVKFAESDITKVGNLYKLSALKAAEVANEAFMNYAAMPSAVKMLRSLPILGSPFASFTYGSIAKTGKTLAANPGFFNNVTFARNEIAQGNPASPIEKSALGSPFNNYLNTYGRMKLPFFNDYPTYLNIANWLPYLGMNIFQPSEREFTNPTAQTIGGAFDHLPFMKGPEGQLLFDYIIQPYVLGEAQPTGMFGQPLYNPDASGLSKAGSFVKSAAESITPPLTPFVGYRFNQLLNATQGKSSQGVPSSKSPWELTTKALLSNLGIALNEINLAAQAGNIKKQLTPAKAKKK